tara:strand:- start:518 stop:748 length:231 start_codon:yes stop_codon:yes gene_type:complete
MEPQPLQATRSATGTGVGATFAVPRGVPFGQPRLIVLDALVSFPHRLLIWSAVNSAAQCGQFVIMMIGYHVVTNLL